MENEVEVRTADGGQLHCWVCDFPIYDGEKVLACPHPEDDLTSNDMAIIVWHPWHPVPSEALDDIKTIVIFYERSPEDVLY